MTAPYPKCDLIIVSYNSTQCLNNCLKSLSEYTANSIDRLFIVNNGHDIDEFELNCGISQTILIQNRKNLGFSKGVNIGLKNSEAPYICLLNPDTVAYDNFLEKSLVYLEKHPEVGALGPKIFSDDGSVQGSARTFPTVLTTFFGRTSWLTRAFPKNSLSKKNIVNIDYAGQKALEVDWVSGACMIVRRNAIRRVGGLDERFFMYWEDADWCRRMRNEGWKIVYYPESEISHACGQSSRSRPMKSILHFHKSCYRLYEKYSSVYFSCLLPLVLLGLCIRMTLLMLKTKLAQKVSH